MRGSAEPRKTGICGRPHSVSTLKTLRATWCRSCEGVWHIDCLQGVRASLRAAVQGGCAALYRVSVDTADALDLTSRVCCS